MSHQSQKLLLSLSQPWFSPRCQTCDELERIVLNNGVAAICKLIEQGKPCKKKIGDEDMTTPESVMEAIGAKFEKLDEFNRIIAISTIDNELVKGLDNIEDLNKARELLKDIALEIGDMKAEDLRILFKEELSMKLPDIQRVLVERLLKEI